MVCYTPMGFFLYMDYDYLPSGSGDIKELNNQIEYYIELINKNDEEEILDFDDWVQEGMSINGKKILTKNLYDKIMKSAQYSIKTPLTVYKTGINNNNKKRWISTTLNKGLYKNWEGEEQEYVLPKGTKVIHADGIADNKEVIIHSTELKKYLK